MPLTLPYTIAAGQPITANPIQSNFSVLAGKFGSIVGSDISPTANIPGQAIAVGTLPANRIVNNDITAVQIAAATITSAQIAAGTISSANMASNALLWGVLKTNVFNWTLPTLSGVPRINGADTGYGGFAAQTTALGSAAIQPLSLMLVTSSDPTGPSGSFSIGYAIYLSTTTNIYWLCAQNVSNTTFTPAGGYVLRLVYANLS